MKVIIIILIIGGFYLSQNRLNAQTINSKRSPYLNCNGLEMEYINILSKNINTTKLNEVLVTNIPSNAYIDSVTDDNPVIVITNEKGEEIQRLPCSDDFDKIIVYNKVTGYIITTKRKGELDKK